jgi:hypothetical protein
VRPPADVPGPADRRAPALLPAPLPRHHGRRCIAVNAGFVNGVAIALTQHPIPHHTGSIARLSRDLAFRRAVDLELVVAVNGVLVRTTHVSGLIAEDR